MKKVKNSVNKILADVKNNGDKSVISYTKKFDGITITTRTIEISRRDITKSWQRCPQQVKRSLSVAKKNIQTFHKRQLPTNWKQKSKNGVTLGQLFIPLEKIGIYVPGGSAPLVSTVLMTAVPAKAAGVKDIIMVSPPPINPFILAAAYLAGVTKVYQVGGAQAIAALAYGTKSIPKVDKIVGPGNVYVTCAKRMVYGDTAIDMPAGPSEILILADNSADIKFIAADLLSQLEHDPLSLATLVTTSASVAKAVRPEIKRQLKELNRKSIILKSMKKGLKIIKVPNIAKSIEIINNLAPEHLELMINKPQRIIAKIKNAGIIMIGNYTPVALSDFMAGTNHVLPTGGTARSFAGLNIWDFLKPVATIKYSKKALQNAKPYLKTFAEIEGLSAHGKSITYR